MTWIPDPGEQCHLLATVIETTPEGVRFHIEGAVGDVMVYHGHLAGQDSPVVAKIGRPLRIGDRVRRRLLNGMTASAEGPIVAIKGLRAWVAFETSVMFPNATDEFVDLVLLERVA